MNLGFAAGKHLFCIRFSFERQEMRLGKTFRMRFATFRMRLAPLRICSPPCWNTKKKAAAFPKTTAYI